MKSVEHYAAGTTARTVAGLVRVNKTTATFYHHWLRELDCRAWLMPLLLPEWRRLTTAPIISNFSAYENFSVNSYLCRRCYDGGFFHLRANQCHLRHRHSHQRRHYSRLVLQRAKEAPGKYDIEFIGDSITQGWESRGSNVWNKLSKRYRVINFGVSGDRTEHVLWRFEQGQLDGIKAKVAIVMIGTNNSNKNKDGTDTYTDSDILEGVTAIVNQIRQRQPDTKILLLGIFPRGKAFNPQRGRLLEINQVLAKLDDSKHIFYFDFGSQYVENDGSISKDIMPDALHPNEAGYKIWAAAIEPKLKELLKK